MLRPDHLLFCFLLFTTLSPLSGQIAGTPDLSFGQAGEVTLEDTSYIYYGGGMTTLLPDGKLMVAGSIRNSDLTEKRVLIRLLPDGSVDASYGVNGMATIDLPTGQAGIRVIAATADGQVIIAGSFQGMGTCCGLGFAARFNTNGELDTSFGINGWINFGIGSEGTAWEALLVKPDGKILIGGGGYSFDQMAAAFVYYWELVQLLPDGSRDPAFGVDGFLAVQQPYAQGITDLTLQNDGKIIVVVGNPYRVLRLLPAGALDPIFADNGTFVPNDLAGIFLTGAHVQTDQKIVVGGLTPSTGTPAHSVVLLRLDANGNYDPTFGTNGQVFTDISISTVYTYQRLAFQPDDKILVSVTNNYSVGANEARVLLLRYQTTGALDSSFGVAGRVQSPPYQRTSVNVMPIKLLLQADGKVVQSIINGKKIVLWRYLNDPLVGIQERPAAAFQFQCSPNPATDQVSLSWTMPTTAEVRCDLYDAQARLQQTVLPPAVLPNGEHRNRLNLDNRLPDGFYFLVLRVGSEYLTRALLKR